MAYSGWLIEMGAKRPHACPEAYWLQVLATLAANPKARIGLSLWDGVWSHEIISGARFQVDEHNGPHLLLAEDDTSQSF